MRERQLATEGLALIVLLLFGGLACAAETDPYKVSTRDLLFNKERLDAHLAARREYLAKLETRLGLLDEELLDSQSRLFATRQQLEAVEQPSLELAALLEEVESLQRHADGLANDILDAQDMLDDRRLGGIPLARRDLSVQSRLGGGEDGFNGGRLSVSRE